QSEFSRTQIALVCLILTLITVVIYLPVQSFEFSCLDDGEDVSENPVVAAGLTWPGVKWAFSIQSSNWHPLTRLSLMVDCQLFGLNAGALHLKIMMLHAANTALFFLVWFRLTRALLPCAFAAALFSWHPLRVESVAWISERKDVLSTLFALLMIWFSIG